jgi:hypothetical protein
MYVHNVFEWKLKLSIWKIKFWMPIGSISVDYVN